MPTLCWIAPLIPMREVELRLDDLPGLADLLAVRDPARVDRGTRRADGAAEGRGQLAHELEAFGPAHAAAAGDDDLGLLDRGGGGLGDDPLHDRGGRPVRSARRLDRLHRAGRPRRLGGHDVRSDGDDAAPRRQGTPRGELAAEHAVLGLRAAVGPGHGRGVGEDAEPGQGGQHARDVAALGPGADEDDLRLVLVDEGGEPPRDDRPGGMVRGRGLRDRQHPRQVARPARRGRGLRRRPRSRPL